MDEKCNENLQMLNVIYNECRCEICRLLFKQPISISCGHTFCKECITKSLDQQPSCPICKFPILYNVQTSQENVLIKSIAQEIEQLFVETKKKKQSRFINDKVIVKQNQKQYCIFFTDTQLFPYMEQNIILKKEQFKELDFFSIVKIFKLESEFILINQKNKDLVYICKLKNIRRHQNNIEIIGLIEEQMKIINIKNHQFQIGNIIIEFPIAKAQQAEDEEIEFDFDTDYQIQTLLDQIFNGLKIHLPTKITSHTEQSLFIFIGKTQVLDILRTDIKRNYQALKKLTFLIPSMLQISQRDLEIILKQTNIIMRLKVISEIIDKYSTITNPLMIFKIPGQQQAPQYIKEFVLIAILIIIAFYYREFGL